MRLLTLCLIGFIATPLQAQLSPAARMADSVRLAIESSVDAGDLPALDRSVALAERAAAAFPGDRLLLHYHAYALYRAAALGFGSGGASRARPHLERVRPLLETLARSETLPETHAVLSSVYGLQIASARIQSLAGIQLGGKASDAMDRAVALGPTNPRVWMLRGLGAMQTPSAFGGGLDKAETYLRKSLELFAADAPAPPLPAWGRADAHIWLGQVLAKQNRRDDARAQYQAALALQPNNAWISTVLLPSLDGRR